MANSTADTHRLVMHVLIEGRVQGVGFRAWTEIQAQDLGLDGWVRNRRTGAVEAVFAGASGAVREMHGRLKRGPPHAQVAAVHTIDDEPEYASGFEVRQTA
ncbi:MAG: acylphosphatase [Hyphomicrobiaceae bacterium]